MSDLFNIHCKDYFIMKIRTYADKHVLDKWHKTNGPTPQQHRDRAMSIYNFTCALIEHVTHDPYDTFMLLSHLDSDECIRELLYEKSGVLVRYGEAVRTYMIPNNQTELIDWFKAHAPQPNWIVKKTNVSFMSEPTDYFRTESTRFYKEKIEPLFKK